MWNAGILGPQPEIGLTPRAVEKQSLNHRATREVPSLCFSVWEPYGRHSKLCAGGNTAASVYVFNLIPYMNVQFLGYVQNLILLLVVHDQSSLALH